MSLRTRASGACWEATGQFPAHCFRSHPSCPGRQLRVDLVPHVSLCGTPHTPETVARHWLADPQIRPQDSLNDLSEDMNLSVKSSRDFVRHPRSPPLTATLCFHISTLSPAGVQRAVKSPPADGAELSATFSPSERSEEETNYVLLPVSGMLLLFIHLSEALIYK